MFVAELKPIAFIGVPLDAEPAAVVHAMMFATDQHQVPRVGRTVVFPVDDVMDLEPKPGVATRNTAAAMVAMLDDCSRALVDALALLARGVRFPRPMYSCLAGFVEPGEDLEGAVIREVKEEVGVDVDDVRYVGSQPWPFPHSLMIGFRVNYSGGEIVLQEDEIMDANWYRKDDLPMIPPTMSIAGRIIEQWINEG